MLSIGISQQNREIYSSRSVFAWHNAKVVVWGHVDAGFQDFFTPPVVLGTIDATPKKSKRWGIF